MIERRIIIVGAGLAGSLLACVLGRRGFRVELFERRPDPRAAGFAGGRSINLALSVRGIHALEKVGLAKRVLADAVPMRGRMMHAVSGELAFQPYSKNADEAINSVSRAGLNLTLLEAASQCSTCAMHFGERCDDVDLNAPAITVTNSQTNEGRIVGGDVIIGADGAFSAVRTRLVMTDRFDYQQDYLQHGYKEFTIPAAKDVPGFTGPDFDGFALEPNALHIWPRGGYMMIALPNQDRSFTCTAFLPFTGPNGFGQMTDDASVRRYFEQRFPDAVPLMPTLLDNARTNPTSSLVTIRCSPWHHEGRALILGDAAHAIVPFYGQGMNAAFEDVAILDGMIDEFSGDWSRICGTFSERRKVDAEAIADLALENFIEMRDRTASKMFLLEKKGQKVLHRLLPGLYEPLYHMVTFSRIPYAEARRRAKRQRRVIQWTAAVVIVIALALLAAIAF